MVNQDLLIYIEEIEGKRALVIGDFTLDRFIIGCVSRVSPEAPVPVVDIEYESSVLGGIANIVNNIQGLGGEALVVTAVGDDPEGDYLLRELEKRGISTQNILRDRNLATTMITRVRSNNGYQLLRMEKSSAGRLSSTIADGLTDKIKKLFKEKPVDVVLISDYGHGVMTPKLISNVLRLAKAAGKKVVVNPKKESFWYYDGADIIRTNRKEASYVTGISPINETSIRNMGIKIISTLKLFTKLK
jgi:D-beta-D-heptose 7-phosphate kinase/D-beta-D-heptose 1-phosphate adenosyltransferase